MKKIKLFCITNKPSFNLEQLNLDLVGVGKNRFSNKYTECILGNNIQHKEQHYSELTFHYWFWKNKLHDCNKDEWVGFCQKRRFWIKEKKKEIINLEDLKNNLLTEVPKEWENIDSILCNPINVGNIKTMKLIKRGWRGIIKDPSIIYNKDKHSIKLHFDTYHGFGNLDKAIQVMDKIDRDDFRNFLNDQSTFNPHIMFIAKPEILAKWFNASFSWLFECEKVIGFKNLKGYDGTRLYAYLAERYLSFWFKKYTNSLDWHWTFYDFKD